MDSICNSFDVWFNQHICASKSSFLARAYLLNQMSQRFSDPLPVERLTMNNVCTPPKLGMYLKIRFCLFQFCPVQRCRSMTLQNGIDERELSRQDVSEESSAAGRLERAKKPVLVEKPCWPAPC